MLFRFIPKIKEQGVVFPEKIPISTIEKEPMLFSSDIGYARANGGPLTKIALDFMRAIVIPPKLHHNNKQVLWPVIDTRSHMLRPGMYPCIPGWHCDGVPRDAGSQPNLLSKKMNIGVTHYTVFICSESGVSRTRFLENTIDIDVDNTSVWQSCHEEIECEGTEFDLDLFEAKEGVMYKFNQTTFHKCMPAAKPGWRWFFRLSYYHSPPINKVRHQSQVYVVKESGGW